MYRTVTGAKSGLAFIIAWISCTAWGSSIIPFLSEAISSSGLDGLPSAVNGMKSISENGFLQSYEISFILKLGVFAWFFSTFGIGFLALSRGVKALCEGWAEVLRAVHGEDDEGKEQKIDNNGND